MLEVLAHDVVLRWPLAKSTRGDVLGVGEAVHRPRRIGRGFWPAGRWRRPAGRLPVHVGDQPQGVLWAGNVDVRPPHSSATTRLVGLGRSVGRYGFRFRSVIKRVFARAVTEIPVLAISAGTSQFSYPLLPKDRAR